MIGEFNATSTGKIDKASMIHPSIEKGSIKHTSTEKGNTSKEDMGAGHITTATKQWIIIPILCFHIAGFVVLVLLVTIFLGSEDDVYQWAWPALIVALAGIPFGFASNVKKLVDAVSPSTASS